MRKSHSNRSLRRIPLDALPGFESAARTLSFTASADELSLTQSAISRQIQSLEQAIGVPLFRRFNRRIELTDDGHRLYRAVVSALSELGETVDAIASVASTPVVSVTTSISFASLWLVPRLSDFRRLHPGIDIRIDANDELIDLERERIDCSIRFCEPDAAPPGAIPMAREIAFPVASPALVKDRMRPMKSPADLRHHVLLELVDARGRVPWLHWDQWKAIWKVPDLKPAGVITFSHYDQVIQAALGGEGVAIGRTPHLSRLLSAHKLVIPFGERVAGARRYFVVIGRASQARTEVRAFTRWIVAEAAREAGSEPKPRLKLLFDGSGQARHVVLDEE
jgi:LysR family transcriptional regulator, glycine cleavage system transcriptional activator